MEITTEQLKEKISGGEQILVDFYGKFCGPCRIMKPMFEEASMELEQSNSKTKLFIFNIETDKDYAISLGIRSIPTIKGFKNGEEVFNNVGLIKKDQIKEIAQNL
jgi:thioredoxin 1